MSEFVEYLEAVFEQFGHIHSRRIFGGYGIYHDGVMFALVADNTLYLKGDATTAEYFEAKGLGQFEYDKGEKIVKITYYQAPEEVFDDPEAAAHWAGLAYEVALRAKFRTKPRKRND